MKTLPNPHLSFILGILFAFSGNTTVRAQDRIMQNINQGWQYLENTASSVSEVQNISNWQPIDLPHTWNNLDATDMAPGYRRDASWYKKELIVQKKNPSKRYFLYFEGVNITSEVYLNGQYVGGHIGGYIGFEVPITDHLVAGANTLMTRVDNGYDPQVIPSQKSDFFIYGGITRDVWLKEVSSTYVSDVKVSTPEVSAKKAKTRVSLSLQGKISPQDQVVLTLKDPAGRAILTKQAPARQALTIDFELRNPVLWHVDDPNLYSIALSIQRRSKALDKTEASFGYRWFEFKKNGPFYLNGERLLLRGTHRHEEHAGVGAAMTNVQHRKDIEMIKEMGGNFVRLGHYPQDPEIYKACDELGLLVWDELPWCRGGVGDETWKENTKRMLEEIIHQNFNHPSVIIWSLGNEIYWLPDFENGDDTAAMNSFLTELNELAHSLDPSRKTAIRKYYAGADIVDVFSPSIWSGWYSGTYKNYEQAIEKSMKKYPRFVHMEYGGSSHLGRHTEQPIDGDGLVNPDEWEEAVNQVEVKNIAQSGDWSENYIVDLFDWHLAVSESNTLFVGNAQWAFKDFGTPLRPENDIPYINQKGLLDREGSPKDAYYVFKSYWSDSPFIYIESHTWTERSGPEGKARNVSVFSNLSEVELIHNGTSLGKKKKDMSQFPACGLNWDVTFQDGANTLKAIGLDKEGNEVEDILEVQYSYEQAGAPVEIALSYEKLSSGNYLVSATARDDSGNRCLDYEERVYFQCLSGGELIKHMGTPKGTEAIRLANGKASIEVTPDETLDPLKIGVLSQDFKGTYLAIRKEKAILNE